MKDGARTEFAPAHTGALHPLLDQVPGATFDGTAGHRQALLAEQIYVAIQKRIECTKILGSSRLPSGPPRAPVGSSEC